MSIETTRNMDTGKFEAMIERMQETIMEDDEVSIYCINQASDGVAHWERMYGPITDERIREELLCQYQVQALNKVFLSIAANK